jgi:hypothetical protein
MGFRVVSAADAFGRPSNLMGVLNSDLGKQAGCRDAGARQRHRADALWLVVGAPPEAANVSR